MALPRNTQDQKQSALQVRLNQPTTTWENKLLVYGTLSNLLAFLIAKFNLDIKIDKSKLTGDEKKDIDILTKDILIMETYLQLIKVSLYYELADQNLDLKKLRENSAERTLDELAGIKQWTAIFVFAGTGLTWLARNIFDISRDLFLGIKDRVPILFSALGGATSFFFLFLEGLTSVKDIYDAYKKNKNVEVLLGLATFMMAGAGTGMAMALTLQDLMGVAIEGAPILNVLVSAFFTAIYSATLYKNLLRTDELTTLKRDAEKDRAEAEKEKKIAEENLATYKNQPNPKPNMLKEFQDKVYIATDHLLQKNLQCDHYNKQLFLAKRTSLFTGFYALSSSFTTVAAIIGTVGILSAGTIASFGTLPLIIALAGIVVSTLTSVVQFVDQYKNFAVTGGMLGLEKPKLTVDSIENNLNAGVQFQHDYSVLKNRQQDLDLSHAQLVRSSDREITADLLQKNGQPTVTKVSDVPINPAQTAANDEKISTVKMRLFSPPNSVDTAQPEPQKHQANIADNEIRPKQK